LLDYYSKGIVIFDEAYESIGGIREKNLMEMESVKILQPVTMIGTRIYFDEMRSIKLGKDFLLSSAKRPGSLPVSIE